MTEENGALFQSKLRQNLRDRLMKTARQKGSRCWGSTPARFSMYQYVDSMLLKVARQRGYELQRIEYLRVANLEGQSILWLYPTHGEDPDRIEIKRGSSKLEINLSDQLEEWGLALPRNIRRQFDVLPDTEDQSPVGPALYIDLNKPLQSKLIVTPRRKAARKAKAKAAKSAQKAVAPASPAQQGAAGAQPQGGTHYIRFKPESETPT